MSPNLRLPAALTACLVAIGLAGVFIYKLSVHTTPPFVLSKSLLATQIGEQISQNVFPDSIDFDFGTPEAPHLIKGNVNYTLDTLSQDNMDSLLKTYKPDYAAFVAIDAQTGKILSLNSYQRDPLDQNLGNITLRAIFPAASIFKIVTAAAAIDDTKLSPDTVFAFNGSSHTLYKRNVAETKINRWTRYMSMREAFAKSINTVFGKMGAFYVGPQSLSAYAYRFQFDREIGSDLPVEAGESFKPSVNDKFEIAEAASGFNKESRMSPLQGSMIASAIINDGVIMEPYIVQSIVGADSPVPLYDAQSNPISIAIKPESARMMKQLMNETVMAGTSRKSFRKIFRRKELFDLLEMGGKTGSLTATDPRAKVDWFIGYASYEGKKIAVAALTANKKYWTVKSSFLAASYFDFFFRDEYADKMPLLKKRTPASKQSRARQTHRSHLR